MGLVFVLSVVAGANAEDPYWEREGMDWKKGKLAHLVRYIGTPQYDKVFDDPHVKAALERQLGPEVRRLKRNMQSRGPIDFISGYLVIVGIRPHVGNEHNAIVAVQIHDGEVIAGIFTQGKYTLYTRKSDTYIEVPQPVWNWVYYDQIKKITDPVPTENFEWIKR
jgi:hypothetical protein